MNTTFVADLDISQSEEELIADEINLKRVIYLMERGDRKMNARHLYKYCLEKKSSEVTVLSQVRALRALFALVDTATIKEITGSDPNDVKLQLQTLIYLTQLERLHVPHTFKSFMTCNKEGLVRGLWRDHNSQRQAVRLVSDLCIDYQVVDVNLWNSVLKQLMAFQMTDYLRHVLVSLSGMPIIWHVGCIQKTWEHILYSPLISAVAPLSDNQKAECLQSLVLLHRCPQVLDMDVLGLAKLYVRLKLPSCALGCLGLLPNREVCLSQAAILFKQHKPLDVLNEITDLEKIDLHVPLHQKIHGLVFDYVDEKCIFKEFLETNHWQALVKYLTQQSKISNLVLFLLEQQRTMECIEVVQNSSDEVSVYIQEKGLEGVEAVRAYCQVMEMTKALEFLPEPEPSPEAVTPEYLNITRADISSWQIAEDD